MGNPVSFRIVVTPTPGAVFLRTSNPLIEMPPAQAIRMAERLLECARVALGAQDGVGLRATLGEKPE